MSQPDLFRRLPPLALTALAAFAGALGTLGIALVALGRTDAEHLALPLGVAVVMTVAVTALGTRGLATSSLRARFTAVAAFATLIGLVNLAVLAWLMVVTEKDAMLIGALLAYSTAAAIGAGLAAARASSDAVERLAEASHRLASGDLSARAGSVGGGRELQSLADDLDAMASRLERSLRAEREAEARRRDLIIAVSHDLRTPLAGLRAMAEAIDDGVVDDPATVQLYTRRMRDLVASLGVLIDDLFEFVQLDAGAIEAETERALVSDVISSAIAACDTQASAKGLRLRTEVGEAGSAVCSPRLTRVVQNLLQNAIRHTPTDGTVVVVATSDGERIELAVEDSGEGVAPELAERVFEPFWRGDTARAGDGSGLGLALAKRIVEALEGGIEVTSAPERGARFSVWVPRAP
jgi:signal transduction histidine kinase